MSILKVLLLTSLVCVVQSNPFFGNNYLIPQSADLARYASAVVSNLNNARSSVSSYVRYPPTASVSLNQGALVLVDYVGNVSRLIGNVYSEISRAATDRTTAPAVVFSKINTQLNALQPLLQNSSVYVQSLSNYFDYEGDSSISSYFAERNDRMKSNVHNLEQILRNISQAIDSTVGQGLNTQQFIAALSVNGVLQSLVDAAQGGAIASNEYSVVVGRLVAAINTANSFRSTANSRIQSSRQSSSVIVNNYVSSSNSSFNSVLLSTDNLFNHLKTLNDSFVFRWPLVLSDRAEQKLHQLNASIESLINNLHFRRAVVEAHYILTRTVFRDQNQPQGYLQEEAELLTRMLANAINPSSCAVNFQTRFYALPSLVHGLLSQCFDGQISLERQGANHVVSVANGFLRSYASAVYSSLEICFRYPFDKMNDCLDQIVNTIDFSGKFFLLDTVTFYLFEQVQSELMNCNTRLMEYVRNAGLQANCQQQT